LTPNELVLTFRGSYVFANFGENRSRKCDRESARRRSDTHTDANRFYNLSHAITGSTVLLTCCKGDGQSQ